MPLRQDELEDVRRIVREEIAIAAAALITKAVPLAKVDIPGVKETPKKVKAVKKKAIW